MNYKAIAIIFLIIISCKDSNSESSSNVAFSAIKKDYSKEINHIISFSENSDYNRNIAFMIDYSLHSGLNRFFVIDLRTKSIIKKGLVCHGSCKGKSAYAKAKYFSDVVDSNCSTLGMAVISERAYSNWGKKYKYWLDGLEDNNKNMRKRIVVLHAWEGVPDEEIYPNSLATSWGCPTVSIKFLDELDKFLKENEKVLLYSFSN